LSRWKNSTRKSRRTRGAQGAGESGDGFDPRRNATTEAIRASEILFGGELKGISENTFNEIIGEVPRVFLDRVLFETHSPLVDVLVLAGVSSSKGQARKDIEGGGIYVSNSREVNLQRQVNLNDFSFGKHLLLRKGKKNYVVVTAK
jgi:tyrosyl-tRNA synthetase